MKRSWLAPLILVTLTVAFLLLWESSPQNFLRPAPIKKQAQIPPANILINPINRSYNEEGRLTSAFKAAETQYFQVDPKRITQSDFTHITQPAMTLYNPQRPPWNLTADSGKISNNATIIKLSDNVRLWHSDELNQTSELTTSYMVLEPKRQYAHTDKPVTIRSVNEITQATGMKAFLKEERIQLLSNVRGIYEPQP